MQRLKTRVQFQAVMGAGATVSRTPHFALHRCTLDAQATPEAPASAASAAVPANEGAPLNSAPGPGSDRRQALFAVRTEPWIGAVVPKRWARRAVTRNTIKRQIYTVVQDFEPQLPAAAHVVRLRSAFDKKQFTSATSEALKRAVRGELQQLFAGAAVRARA